MFNAIVISQKKNYGLLTYKLQTNDFKMVNITILHKKINNILYYFVYIFLFKIKHFGSYSLTINVLQFINVMLF